MEPGRLAVAVGRAASRSVAHTGARGRLAWSQAGAGSQPVAQAGAALAQEARRYGTLPSPDTPADVVMAWAAPCVVP